MDISIIENISCDVLEDGATINSQILYDIVRKIDENSEIEIISNNGKLHFEIRRIKIFISMPPKRRLPNN